MTISTGDILRLVLTYLWDDGNVVQNVYNAVVTGGGGPWDDDDIMGDFANWHGDMNDELTSFLASELSGSQKIGYVYDAIDDDWDEIATQNMVKEFTGATDELPRGAAALLNARTTDPDTNGKKYIGGTIEGMLENGLWSAAMLAALVGYGGEWVTAFVGPASGADYTPGIWSPTNTVFTAMSGTVIIPTMPAYQRRRKRGVGI